MHSHHRNRKRAAGVVLVLCLVAISTRLTAAEVALGKSGDDKTAIPFRLTPGTFPPAGSAHRISGELIALDHVNRTGVLRQDRTAATRRRDWDLPLPFRLLPYGSLTFRGAPAELRDIPLGTHLQGQFYFDPQAGPENKGAFTQAIRLEDDFSHCARQQRAWRVDAVAIDKGLLTVTGIAGKELDPKPTLFQINSTTRIWRGRTIGLLTDLAVGQSILLNLTGCTLKGPGRCTDIWIDSESRSIATNHQLEIHRQFQREHGLAGWVDEVDNQAGIVTVTLFDGFDPKLGGDFVVKESLISVVAEESLRSFDQRSDRMRGEILDVQSGAPGPGNSGIRIQFKPLALLEGFRPKRIVRLFAGAWNVDALPKEERLYGVPLPTSLRLQR